MRRKNEGLVSIEENAIFIADSHYPHHGDAFLDLLKKIESEEIKTTQVFLMGDNFDLLFGHNDYIQTFSEEAIAILQKLSKNLEIHYFEGNHDFCLDKIFLNINVYSRAEQPIEFLLGDKRVAISHGDKFATGLAYDVYSKILRNKVTLTFLRPFDKFIINHRMKKLSRKSICHTYDGFEKRIKAILGHYQDADIVIEGHFHQSKIVGKYISLPSQACQAKVGVIEEGKMHFKSL